MRRSLLAVLVLLGGSPSVAMAVDIDQLSVAKDGPAYIAEADFVVNLPVDQVVVAFTDFDRLPDLNPTIVKSESEIQNDGTARVRTQIRACIAFVCRSITMIEQVRHDSRYLVQSRIVPNGSDFSEGLTTWVFTAENLKTRVEYRSRVIPDFWMPPWLGARAIRASLKKQISTTATSIEAPAGH